jgi:hypothetical protein
MHLPLQFASFESSRLVSLSMDAMPEGSCAGYVTHPFSNETIFILALRRCDPSFRLLDIPYML